MMPSPTTARGILGQFEHGTNPPTVFHPISSPPVWAPIYFSLQAILAAGASGRGCRAWQGGRTQDPLGKYQRCDGSRGALVVEGGRREITTQERVRKVIW